MTSFLKRFKAAAVACAFSPILSNASPVYSFDVVLTVKEIPTPCAAWPTPYPVVGCGASIGDRWTGTFELNVDPRSLPDGGIAAPFLSMHLETGGLTWDHCALNHACVRDATNVLEGYRDVLDPEWFSRSSTGFYIKGGQIVGFAGGFFGEADVPFIDFDYFDVGAGRFRLVDLGGEFVNGEYSITQNLPIPDSLVLASTALLLASVLSPSRKPRSIRLNNSTV